MDEIDAVRSLPFSTDDFFAAIRECYNRRAEDRVWDRLTFCMIGVASPTDLIRDTRMTPFNIGRRIELSDFTSDEAAPLARGLTCGVDGAPGRAEKQRRSLLERILHWTGGHPYLTQRLCLEVAEYAEQIVASAPTPCTPYSPSHTLLPTPSDVDRLCKELFLSQRAQERDDNLIFVRERLLRSEADLVALLTLYVLVWSGKRPLADQTNALVPLLQLSGVARANAGRLHVRNRIYHRVFDHKWVKQNFPDAEARRQRGAYRRGMARAAFVAAGVLAVVGWLGATAAINARLRLAESNHVRQIARELRRNLYAADLSSAQAAVNEDNIGLARALLNPYRPRAGQEDLRTFEWYYIWEICRDRSLWTFEVPSGGGNSIAFSRDGCTLAVSGCNDGRVRLYDTLAHRELEGPPQFVRGVVWAVTYSADGHTLAVHCMEGKVVIWDIAGRREIGRIDVQASRFQSIVISPDNQVLAATSTNGPVTLWNIHPLRKFNSFAGHEFVAFSPDGRTLATQQNGDVVLWNLRSRRKTTLNADVLARVTCIAFSPDGRRLSAGFTDGNMRMWDVASGRALTAPGGHKAWVSSVAYSPNGSLLASGSEDSTIKLWDPRTGSALATLRGHDSGIGCVAFSADSKRLASATGTGIVKLWNVAADSRQNIGSYGKPVLSLDGRLVATEGPIKGVLTLRETDKGRLICQVGTAGGTQFPVGFSKNAETFYAIHSSPAGMHSVVAWDVRSSREAGRIPFDMNDVASALCNISPDGRLLAVSSNDIPNPYVQLFDLAAMRAARQMHGYQSAFSPDSRFIAVGPSWPLRGWPIRVYDAATGRDAGPPIETPASRSTFSPDGRLLLAGLADGRIQVWDLHSRAIIKEFRAHTSMIKTLALSPDGETLVTAAGAPLLKFWNTRTWRQTLVLPTSEPYGAFFSPDGQTLYATRMNRSYLVLPAPRFTEPSAIIIGRSKH